MPSSSTTLLGGWLRTHILRCGLQIYRRHSPTGIDSLFVAYSDVFLFGLLPGVPVRFAHFPQALILVAVGDY